MLAYKGFNKDLASVMGDGKKETCIFHPGETKTVPESKTARNGFHCCENPFDCLKYYPMDGKNRFFLVEAGGDIDEDDHRIACTQIRLERELSYKTLVAHGVLYMDRYPDREGWECRYHNLVVVKDKGEADGGFLVVRGERPMAKASAGSMVFLLAENPWPGENDIVCARMVEVAPVQQGRWLTLDLDGEVIEVETEEG